MNKSKYKIKTVSKNEKTHLIISLKSKDAVSESLLKLIESPEHSELLNATWTKSGGSNKLTFDISGMVSLKDYLKAAVEQEKYFRIIKQIQTIHEKCRDGSIPAGNLLCSSEYVFYDPKTSDIYMICVPVADTSNSDDIVDFLFRLHKKAPVRITDLNAVNRYRDFLEARLFLQKKNKSAVYAYDDISDFFNGTSGHTSGNTESIPEKHYSSPEIITPAPNKIARTVKAVFRSGKRSETPENAPYLEDQEEKKYVLTRFPFSIGRDPSSDLFIENANISSRHAFIEEKNGSYFIRDNDSTNGTYINDRRISSEQLTDGCEFSVYDVVFTFHSSTPKQISIKNDPDGSHPVTTTFAVSSRKKHIEYIAYIQEASTERKIFIPAFPFSSDEFEGIEFTGSEHDPQIKNISCDQLLIETESIDTGAVFSIYSGCSFSIGQKKYLFYLKY